MIESIKNRRSIRKYKSKVVDKEAITKILQPGMLAPSSKNCQLWKFAVATESAKTEAVKQWKRELVARKKNLLFRIVAHISMGQSIRFGSCSRLLCWFLLWTYWQHHSIKNSRWMSRYLKFAMHSQSVQLLRTWH
mgnify:CR=1 FL=1